MDFYSLSFLHDVEDITALVHSDSAPMVGWVSEGQGGNVMGSSLQFSSRRLQEEIELYCRPPLILIVTMGTDHLRPVTTRAKGFSQ